MTVNDNPAFRDAFERAGMIANLRLAEQDLWSAQKLLIDRGWTRGDYITASGEMCAVGAIREAVHPGASMAAISPRTNPAAYNRTHAAAEALVAVIPGRYRNNPYPGSFSTIIRYNDKWWRRKWAVLWRFGQARKRLRTMISELENEL